MSLVHTCYDILFKLEDSLNISVKNITCIITREGFEPMTFVIIDLIANTNAQAQTVE